jgi:hypothetical protein
MATCPEAISTVVAPMRLANWAFGVRRDRLVVLGDQVPGRQGLPGRDAHDVAERGQRSVRRCGARVRPRSMSLIARALTPEVSAASSSVMPAARR